MEHLTDDDLTRLALGEEPTPPAAGHLRHCDRCARELAALRHVVVAVRTPQPDEDALLTPPDGLWESIAAELDVDPRVGRPGDDGSGTDTRGGAVDAPRDESAPNDEPAPTGGRRRPDVKRRRLSRLAVALAACAALFGAAAGSGVTWWVTHDGGTTSSAPGGEGARLDSLRPRSAGYARLDGSGDHRTLDITVKGLPKTSGYFEVWLMDRTHQKLISMGSLGPDGHAVLPVPSTVDLGEYAVVDVSVQPYNGKPDHSGDSIVRGPYAG
ncbi:MULTISPECIES: anti-sigma factor [unclassified Streptomyces]|uniref:anti-sigma factor n=1 Tax=unclassified Streptomyces TaxID=2593676 RepID=UPI00381B4573